MKMTKQGIVRLLPILLLGAAGGRGEETRFELQASPMDLVTNEAAFLPFAEGVRDEVERLLGVPSAVDDPAILSLLLSTRVHLAHHFGDDEKAIATAAWIRTRQSDPAVRAFAGLTTLASVEARQRHPGALPSDAEYRRTFLEAFSRWLGSLPHTAEIVTMLRNQREKIAGITRESLLAEMRDTIIPVMERTDSCGLAEADKLVRVRHRMVSIVPVRAETLEALDTAIAARSSP